MSQIPLAISDEIESINFPSIPHVLLQFLKVVEDDNSRIADLAKLVGQDPALSARFLTVANSPALRRDREILSLERCMITLGTCLTRTLAACLAVQTVFSRSAGEIQYELKGFWGHSLRVAELSRALAAKKNYCDVEEAYLTGLLHDVGLLLLLGNRGVRYGDLLKLSIDESVLSDIEKPMIGTDHAAVGSWLVDHWKLSSFMSDAILFHHKPSTEIVTADTLSQIVWSAHIMSGYTSRIDRTRMLHTPDLVAVASILGIEMADIAAILEQTSSQVAQLADALGVVESENSRILPSPLLASEHERLRLADPDPVHAHMDEMVRDMALMQSLQHNLAVLHSEEDIFIAIRESAKILFSLSHIAFLIVNSDENTLSGAHFSGQSGMLKRLEIQLDTSNSLVAAVASDTEPCSTFDKVRPAEISLVDIQITRILCSDGLLYVPMRIDDRGIGVMVYGISESQHALSRKQLPWMTRFAHLAATSIDAWRGLRNTEKQIAAEVADRYELQARRVIHEAGNPLSIIKNYLKIVSLKIPGENEIHHELDILREEIDRVSHILLHLDSANALSPKPGTVDINGVIEGMLSLYSDSLFSVNRIKVEKTLDPALVPINCDQDGVKQILLNIWKNAAEAMPDGGRIAICTKDNVPKNGHLFVEILLSDSGPGLPTDVRQRLFQQLEPDRRPGHSGLGLSIVAMLVAHLGGHISCQSEVGNGTTFSILLPHDSGQKK
ncbi:MAG TPA: HDOD domain-containing protein [Desulfuromonadales bacterium]|nr:HDOD domain-containing protein [Desulfuromonadales bacterium]